jgi:antitoxin HicB
MLKYPVELTKDDNDTFLVRSPDFPELITFGETYNDALDHARGALEEAIAARIADKEDIPTPSRGRVLVGLPTLTALKTSLYSQMRQKELKPADLMRRLKWHRNQVDRLFRLDHNTRMDQLDEAFHALDLDIRIDFVEADPDHPD